MPHAHSGELGLQMGERALMLRKRAAFRSPMVMAPWPPIEWPMMEQRSRSSCREEEQ